MNFVNRSGTIYSLGNEGFSVRFVPTFGLGKTYEIVWWGLQDIICLSILRSRFGGPN